MGAEAFLPHSCASDFSDSNKDEPKYSVPGAPRGGEGNDYDSSGGGGYGGCGPQPPVVDLTV